MDGWMDGLTEQDALTIHSGCVPQKRRRKSHQSSSRTLTNYPENYFGVRQAHLPQQGQHIVDNLRSGIQRTGVTSIVSGNSGGEAETFPTRDEDEDGEMVLLDGVSPGTFPICQKFSPDTAER